MPVPRQIIRERAAERGFSFSALSIMAGRNEAYVQQLIECGSPKKLPDDERRLIATALDLDETLLGARMPWMPAVGHAAVDHG